MHHHNLVHRILAEAYVGDLRRAAARDARRRAATTPAPGTDPIDVPFTIRRAWPADARAIARLAELDSAAVPAAPLLVAFAGSELRAALSLRDGATIADPFRPTVAARELLRIRASQLLATRPSPPAGRVGTVAPAPGT